jgi:hypothetical protein
MARVSVPLEKRETRSVSIAGEVPGVGDDTARILVWTVLPASGSSSSLDAVASVARALAPRRVPFVFVAFDPTGDTAANRKQVIDALGQRRVGLVLVLVDLTGNALQFTTPNGDLIPALDLYADRAGAKHALTRSTSSADGLGDVRDDAAALIGYLAGRSALGAEELPR